MQGGLITSSEHWIAYLKELEKEELVVLDLETTGLSPWIGDKLVGVALKSPNLPAIYCPFRHISNNLPLELLQYMASFLHKTTVILHHSAFDIRFLLKEGLPFPSNIEDTMIAAHLLDCSQSAALKKLGVKYIDPAAADDEKQLEVLLTNANLKGKENMWLLPPEQVAGYAAQDAELTWKLREWQKPHLERWGLEQLYRDRCTYQQVLLKAEQRGFLLNKNLIQQYSSEAKAKMGELKEELGVLAGHDVNPASPKQMCQLLNVKSSAEKILRQLGEDDRRVAALLDFRGWAKVESTYYQAFLELADSSDVLHSTFKINGTVSGRLSMESPNLQAVPRYSEIAKVKDVFLARPGHILLECDYAAMELRMTAHYTKEPSLVEAFKNGTSPHDSTAAKMGISRDRAKTLNFAVLYGAGPKKIAETLGISLEEGRNLLAEYWKSNSHIYRFMHSIVERARTDGYIRLWSGMVSRFDKEIPYEANGPKSRHQPRSAFNRLIQGGSSEVMRRAIDRLNTRLPADVHLLLTVHDSVIYEVPEEHELSEIAKIIREVMEFNPEFEVPFLVDIKAGKNWGNMTKLES